MKVRLLTKANLIIFLIVALAFAVAYLNQHYAGINNKGVAGEIYIEKPSQNYERVRIDELPARHHFTEENENIFIVFASEKIVRNLKVSICYKSESDFEIRPFPETEPKHAELYSSSEDGKKGYEALDDIANSELTYVIDGVPGQEIEIVDVSSKFITSPGTGNDYYYKLPYFIVLLLIALPLYWLVHARESLSQWFLVGVSFVLLFLVDYRFLLVLSALMLFLFWTRRFFKRASGKLGIFLACVFLCLGFLGVFKYFPDVYYNLFFTVGAIPIGLSYFFFRMMYVVMEWYRGMHLDLNFRKFLCYLVFFPTIPAGPIETLDGFYANRIKKLDTDTVISAITRILIGFLKKAFVVNFLLREILFTTGDSLYSQLMLNPAGTSYPELATCLLLLLLYSYVDFSAYSDIAIGVGLLFGYRICENFNFPLLRRNTAEFWKTYHMSLGNWCRRNVYFPVLMTTRNTSLAIFLTFLTMGFWHHLNLNWGVWALHQSIGVIWIMILEETGHRFRIPFLSSRIFQTIWTPIAVGIMIFYAAGCMTMIYIEDIGTALSIYLRYFTFH